MMDVASIHEKIQHRYIDNKPALMQIDTYALSMIAADVASYWGLQVTDGTFYRHDIAEVVKSFHDLNDHDKAQLEWAILDNVSAFCAWMPPERQNIRTAALWAEYRPPYLNPMRYR